ncbi:hypothetical protein KZ293_26890, partial [Escherichia coli]|nr:hypothetical protein [Escherichia coli]
MIRHHQARSAMLLQISSKSTGNFDIFKNLSSNPQPNHSSQVTVFQQVSICITADGCAFYTIPIPLQPLSPFFFFKRTVFVRNYDFR